MLKEFRDFAMRGNVIDLAIGIIIGAAFTTVVNSLVKDIIMPPIGYIMNGVDFSNFFLVLKGEAVSVLEGGAGRRSGQRQLRRLHQRHASTS